MGLRSHPWVIPVLILIIVMLFGSSKLPDLARNMGRALKIVKKEVKELREEDAPSPASAPAPTAPAPVAPASAAPQAAPAAPAVPAAEAAPAAPQQPAAPVPTADPDSGDTPAKD